MQIRTLLTAFALILYACSFAQLVNIESLRMHTDHDRFVLENNLNFSYNDDNGSSVWRVANSLGTQFKSKDLNKIYLFLANYSLTRAEGQDFQNSWFVHLRFNYKLASLFKSKAFRVEAFVQSQHNELLDVNDRNLFGAGLRFKVISNENEEFNKTIPDSLKQQRKGTMRMYLGYAYMYEIEKSDAFDSRFYNHRNSSYLSMNFVSRNEIVKVINTIYYQPLFRNFSNYRISEQFQVKLKISETLDANGTFTYYFNSHTPQDRKEYSSNLSLGLGINL